MTSSFYRNNAAVLLIFDITDTKSFEDVRGFLEECNRYNPESVKLLVGCKFSLNFVCLFVCFSQLWKQM
jgi:GTPase SAR1 family protein